jgi:hypothetical protein
MKSRMALIVSLFVLAVGATACQASPTHSSAAPTATLTPASPGGEERTITLADDGKAITLGIGESFLLKLGEGYDWSVVSADPTIVSRVVNVMVVRGAQGLYRAHKIGATTLTATGDPACRHAQRPCEMPSREFHIQVVVQ